MLVVLAHNMKFHTLNAYQGSNKPITSPFGFFIIASDAFFLKRKRYYCMLSLIEFSHVVARYSKG